MKCLSLAYYSRGPLLKRRKVLQADVPIVSPFHYLHCRPIKVDAPLTCIRRTFIQNLSKHSHMRSQITYFGSRFTCQANKDSYERTDLGTMSLLTNFVMSKENFWTIMSHHSLIYEAVMNKKSRSQIFSYEVGWQWIMLGTCEQKKENAWSHPQYVKDMILRLLI